MKAYSYRNKDTGEFDGRVVYGDDSIAALNCPEGFEIVEGAYPASEPLVPALRQDIAAMQLIVQLEQRQHRALREFLLNNTDEGRKRLQAIDDEIAQLRAKL